MGITLERRHRNGDVRKIKVEGRRDGEEEVMVRHGTVLAKWKTWNYEDFSRGWNKTYST
jgi:hypothetical protein